MSFIKDSIPNFLNWLLGVLELLIVLAIALVIGYGVVCFLWGTNQDRFVKLIAVINDNWKAALVLLIPLFYRPIRIYLEQLDKGPFGMQRRPARVEQEQKDNP
jgi:hypothetical protein